MLTCSSLFSDRVIEELRNPEVWTNVYSYIAKYVHFHQTFWPDDIDPEYPIGHLPFYALVVYHSAFVLQTIRVIRSEAALNAGTNVAPDDKKWKKDLNLRGDLGDLYQSICLAPSIKDFDRDDLVERAPEQSLKAQVSVKSANLKVMRDNMVTMPSPPPKKRCTDGKSVDQIWSEQHSRLMMLLLRQDFVSDC